MKLPVTVIYFTQEPIIYLFRYVVVFIIFVLAFLNKNTWLLFTILTKLSKYVYAHSQTVTQTLPSTYIHKHTNNKQTEGEREIGNKKIMSITNESRTDYTLNKPTIFFHTSHVLYLPSSSESSVPRFCDKRENMFYKNITLSANYLTSIQTKRCIIWKPGH